MSVQTTAEKLVVFGAIVDSTLEIQADATASIKAAWRQMAEKAVSLGLFGPDWIHIAMLSKRDEAIVATAKRKTAELKAVNSETYKTIKEYASGIKAAVVDRVKVRSEDGGNPREQWSRFLAYAVEAAGLTDVYVPKEAKAPGTGSGTTSYDKVAEALRVLRNHLPQCEPQAVENVLELWADIEEAAVTDGLLKESV
jgi:hypothetical protein